MNKKYMTNEGEITSFECLLKSDNVDILIAAPFTGDEDFEESFNALVALGEG